jgi:alkyl hydroperoxide reductase subunit AhpF
MFNGLSQPVELVLVDEGGSSELDTLLREVEDLSAHVTYRRAPATEAVQYGLDESLLPAIALGGPQGYSRARFTGAPAGHEFGVLIQDIIDLSNEQIELSDSTKRYLDGLTEDVHLQVFTTPT